MRSLIAGLIIVLTTVGFGNPDRVAAQSPLDTVARTDSTVPRAWLSLGIGGGSSTFGDRAVRAAASVAVTRVLLFTLEVNDVGGFDRSVSSVNLMAGAQSSDSTDFLFASAGLANVSCGSRCERQTGLALNVGYHGGWSHIGGGLAAFVVRGRSGINSGGVVATFDVGSFSRRRTSSQR